MGGFLINISEVHPSYFIRFMAHVTKVVKDLVILANICIFVAISVYIACMANMQHITMCAV